MAAPNSNSTLLNKQTKQTSNLQNDQNSDTTTNIGTMNYARATKNQQQLFPNKNQGIILNAVDEIPLEDYIIAIGDIVGPDKITHFSKLSNNRINIYLTNKDIAEKLVKEHKTVLINNKLITVRHLITPNKRIVISNACPSIPHHIIEQELKQLGLKITSSMTFLRAGLHIKGYEHILSFRRQLFVEEDEKIIIPETFILTHENTPYRIFITDESYYCNNCKKHGHKTEKCKYVNKQTTENTTNIIQTEAVHETQKQKTQETVFLEPISNTNLTNTNRDNKTEDTQHSKRSAPSISSMDSMESLQNENLEIQETKQRTNIETEEPTPTKVKNKKPKRSISPGTPIEEWLRPAKELFKSSKFILTYDNFYNFLESAHGNSDTLNIAREYTNNINGLLHMMKELNNFTTNRSAKIKLTKTINKLEQQMQDESISDEEMN